jgi:hypothetical protein
MDLNPQYPRWFHYPLCMNHYRLGEYEPALAEAKLGNLPHLVWTPLCLAVSAGQLGRVTEAAAAFDLLQKHHPSLMKATATRALWALWQWDEALLDRLIEGFEKARMLIA